MKNGQHFLIIINIILLVSGLNLKKFDIDDDDGSLIKQYQGVDKFDEINNLCRFDDDLIYVAGNEFVELTLTHKLFKTDALIPGLLYQVHIRGKSLTEFAVKPSISTSQFSSGKASKENGMCEINTFNNNLQSESITLNWTLSASIDQLENNISFRINFKVKDNPEIFQAIFTFPVNSECQLYLHSNNYLTTLSNIDIPSSLTGNKNCQIWFPSTSNDKHDGIIVELTKLNVPCQNGFIQFAELNQSRNYPDRIFQQLCGKLEELSLTDRHIYFPESGKSQPFMQINGNPTFSIQYRLVDYCYNITLVDKDGTIELKPITGQIECTFRIYMPFGNRIAFKLQIGENLETTESVIAPLIFQDVVRSNDQSTYCSDGLLIQLHDGNSHHWFHCHHPNDPHGQIEILSKTNKMVLMVSLKLEKFRKLPKIRISYTAEAIRDIVGSCDFGWIMMSQFCISVMDFQRISWPESEKACLKTGGHLVSVKSERDQKMVNELLKNSPNYDERNAYWIGASDRTHESDFRWSDGLTFSYTNWFPGWPQHQFYNKQPNDDGLSDQDCVEVRRNFILPSSASAKGLVEDFMWNDRDCASKNFFICEKLQNNEALEENWSTDCNRTVKLSRQVPRTSITSPGFPKIYPDNAECDTIILAPSGYRIILDFDELVIEAEPNCSYDYLEIIDQHTATNISSTTNNNNNNNNASKRFCGDWSAKLKLLRFVSYGSRIILRFSSDYSHNYGGFKVRVSMENTMLCGDERLYLFNNACYLVVNYPEVTWSTAHQICRGMKAFLTSILTPEEERFITSIIRKNPEYRTSALYWLGGKADPAEKFQWIDGFSMDFQGWFPSIIGLRTSKNDLLELISDQTRCIGLKWKPSSQSSVLSSGLYWTVQRCNQVGGYVCKRKRNSLDSLHDFNKTINSPEGTFTTPNYPDNYFNNLDFLVKIVGPERTRLKIRFSSFDIESQQDCLYDYVEMKSVSRKNKKLLHDNIRYCGNNVVTQMDRFSFISQTNSVEIKFHSDYSVSGTGFSLSWTSVDVSACPIQTLTAREGLINSPNYPDFLLSYLDCSIIIQAPKGKRIWLEFTDMDLMGYKESANNNGNKEVTFEMQLGRNADKFRPFQFNGLLTEGNFKSFDEMLSIKLVTGKFPKGRGFQALYHISDESSIEEKVVLLKNDSWGNLLHINYPQKAPINLNFLQRFVAPLGHVISLELFSLKLSHHTECDNDNDGIIEIFDNYSDINGTLWKLCYPVENLDPKASSAATNAPIFIKSFLNTIQLRQKNNLFMKNLLNGTLRVLPDDGYKKKLINYVWKQVESCKPNPCQNAGKCIEKKSKKICQCSGHFTGLFCAITQCDLEPCIFGSCELTNTSYKCRCKSGYVGSTCDQKRKPCEGNPCESRGICMEKGNNFVCRCHAWWEGQRCEKRMHHIPYKPLSERMLHEPFWLGLMTVFVVMAVIGLVWCAKRHFPEKIEKLLAEDDNRNRLHSLRSTSVREQLAAATSGGTLAGSAPLTATSTSAASPGTNHQNRSIFGRLGIRKPSILSLTSPHAGTNTGGYSHATARTFSLDDLLKPSPRRSPSPKKKRNNSTPTKKSIAEKKQILQHLISPVINSNNSKHVSKRVSLGELIQMTEHHRNNNNKNDGIQSAPTLIVKETSLNNLEPALTVLNDPKLEKKVTFARLLNKVSAEMSSGSDLEMLGHMQHSRLLSSMFPLRPSSTPPSPSVVNRSPNSTSSNQGSDSFTSSDLALPTTLSSSISDLLSNNRRNNNNNSNYQPISRQKPASADSILAMFRNFSSSSAGINLSSSLKISPSTTPTASSPHDDVVGDDESSSSSINTPSVSFSSGPLESPILHNKINYNNNNPSEVPSSVLDPINIISSVHRNSGNLLHPPPPTTILLEIPNTINKCLSPIRELPTPFPSPMPSPAITPIMRRSQSPIARKATGHISASSLEDFDNNSDDKISIEIPNISISATSDDEDLRCKEIVYYDPQAEDGLIFEEAAAMQKSALYRIKNRPIPLGQLNDNDQISTSLPPPLVIPTFTIETPSPTRKTPTLLIPGSPPPHRSHPENSDAFQFFSTTNNNNRSNRKMFKDFEKPTSLDLPNAPPVITITCNMSSEVDESDLDTGSPAIKLSAHSSATGMTYLSPFSMAHRAEQHTSESNLSSSGYSSMASPGPSRCGSSNPLCPSEMEDPRSPCSGLLATGNNKQSCTVLRPGKNPEYSACKTLLHQGVHQNRRRSDSETLSDDPLIESNDEGIGTDHIDEKIDEGEVKSAKELKIFMISEGTTEPPKSSLLLDLPVYSASPSLSVDTNKCISRESSSDRLLTSSGSKNSLLQLPSIVVQGDGEKYKSPVSSRSESPLSDRTTGIGRFSPLFYGKSKDLLPFTDSDGLYDYPSSDKVNITTSCQHKKVGRKREKRASSVRNCKTPSPTKQPQMMVWHNNHLDVPSINNKEKSYFKVPPPRKLSPKRRLARTQVVNSSSSSDSIASAKDEIFKHSSSSPSPDTIRWSSSAGWTDDTKNAKFLEADFNASSPMLSKSLDFTKQQQPKYQKISKLRAISNQIRFLKRLEQSLKKRERIPSPDTDISFDSEEDSPKVTSPLLQQQPNKNGAKVEIRKSNSEITTKTNKGTKYKHWSSLQEPQNWPPQELSSSPSTKNRYSE